MDVECKNRCHKYAVVKDLTDETRHILRVTAGAGSVGDATALATPLKEHGLSDEGRECYSFLSPPGFHYRG